MNFLWHGEDVSSDEIRHTLAVVFKADCHVHVLFEERACFRDGRLSAGDDVCIDAQHTAMAADNTINGVENSIHS